MFLLTSDRRLVEAILEVMLAAPAHVAADGIRGAPEFDGRAIAAHCKVPGSFAITQSATSGIGVAADRGQWLDRRCWQLYRLEVPDQVDAMIEAFLRLRLTPACQGHRANVDGIKL